MTEKKRETFLEKFVKLTRHIMFYAKDDQQSEAQDRYINDAAKSLRSFSYERGPPQKMCSGHLNSVPGNDHLQSITF
jgi:hypothetical protein